MTSNETSKGLALPDAHQIQMEELGRLGADIKRLLQLLDLLQKPEGEARKLADTLRDMASEIGDIGVQLAQMKEDMADQRADMDALKDQLDRIESMLSVIVEVKEGSDGY